MKVAVSASGKDMSATVEPRFGRCLQFMIVETETMQFEILENPNLAAAGGVGIQSAQLLANNDVHVVLTGNCGPNAFRTLQAAGIEVFIGVSGTIQAAIEQYKNGQLQTAAQPNVEGHFGSGGMGAGRGQGRRR